MKEYYDARAPEYDDWWLGSNHPEAADWLDERDRLFARLGALPPRATWRVEPASSHASCRAT